MKNKKLVAMILSLMMVFQAVPVMASNVNNSGKTVVVDETSPYDGTDSVAVNTSLTTSESSGTLPSTSKLQLYLENSTTTLNNNTFSGASNIMGVDDNGKYILDPSKCLPEPKLKTTGLNLQSNIVKSPSSSYSLGSTKNLAVTCDADTGELETRTFKVVYIGTNCTVWTPVSPFSSNDSVTSSDAKLIGDEFDSKYA